jgi:hypothetical protein
MTFDREAFEERAAIMEYDAGMTRFQAETKAAQAQGVTRWEALGDVARRLVERAGHNGSVARKSRPDNVPGMQPRTAEEVGPVSERKPNR